MSAPVNKKTELGHTALGKIVYRADFLDPRMNSWKGWTKEDHAQAAALHLAEEQKLALRRGSLTYGSKTCDRKMFHRRCAMYHHAQAMALANAGTAAAKKYRLEIVTLNRTILVVGNPYEERS